MPCSFTKQVPAQLDSLDVKHEFRPARVHGWLQEAAIETAVFKQTFWFPFSVPSCNFQHLHSGPLAEEHCDRWIHQAILAISLDLAGSEGFVRRCRVVKQHDMFQENSEHVPRILFARSCVLVGVFFRELL